MLFGAGLVITDDEDDNDSENDNGVKRKSNSFEEEGDGKKSSDDEEQFNPYDTQYLNSILISPQGSQEDERTDSQIDKEIYGHFTAQVKLT